MDRQTFYTIHDLLAFRHDRPPAVQRLRDTLDDVLESVRLGHRPEAGGLWEAAEELVEMVGRFRLLQPDDGGTSTLVLNAFSPDDEPAPFCLASHMLNVAVLATHLCSERFDDHQRLLRLALAGLVHDVGMVRLPPALFEREGPLDAEDKALLRQHTAESVALISSWGEPLASLAEIVAQEHERLDGSGYPRGLEGEEVCLEARALGLADSYEALTHHRPYRAAKCAHDVMRSFVAVAAPLFGRELSKLAIRRFSLYPIGSVVEISSQELGVVVGINYHEPMRPLVFIVGSREAWRPAQPRVVDLAEKKLLHVLRALPQPQLNGPVVNRQTASV